MPPAFRCQTCRMEALAPDEATGHAWLGNRDPMPCGHQDAEFLPFPPVPGLGPGYRGTGMKA